MITATTGDGALGGRGRAAGIWRVGGRFGPQRMFIYIYIYIYIYMCLKSMVMIMMIIRQPGAREEAQLRSLVEMGFPEAKTKQLS